MVAASVPGNGTDVSVGETLSLRERLAYGLGDFASGHARLRAGGVRGAAGTAGLSFGLGVLGSFTGAPVSALLWAMYADTVDYAEWKTERRSTGLVFATLMFAGKQGWAFGAALSLALMSLFGFVANAQQTPESLQGLLLLVSVVPAAIGAVGLGIICFYPLDDARVAQIGEALRTRRNI
jgi:glycoside/pentoside/hexuronide:cation symporter, GPH family